MSANKRELRIKRVSRHLDVDRVTSVLFLIRVISR